MAWTLIGLYDDLSAAQRVVQDPQGPSRPATMCVFRPHRGLELQQNQLRALAACLSRVKAVRDLEDLVGPN